MSLILNPSRHAAGGDTFDPAVGARADRTSDQSISNASWTPVQFNAEDFDTDAFHDNATNPSRFTIPSGKGGKYLAAAIATWASSGAGRRYRALAVNGTRIANMIGHDVEFAGHGYMVSDVIDLAVGDYVETHVYQDSGGSLNVLTGSYFDLLQLPDFVGARANRATSDQTISNATWTPAEFNAEDFDTDGYHDNATNPSRFTVPSGKAGKYLVTSAPLWAGGGGNRYRAIAVNGTRILHMFNNGINLNGTGYQVTDIVDLAEGDYVEIHVYQTSGGNLGFRVTSYASVTLLDPFAGARGNRTTTQTITASTWTSVEFDAEDFDTDDYHDNATNPSRFTVPSGKAGKYLVTSAAAMTAGSGNRGRALAVNGTRIREAFGLPGSANGTADQITDIVDLAEGDYVEAQVYHDDVTTEDVMAGSYLAMAYLGA